MVKVLELFAGIGACSSALDRLGIEHEIVDAVEIDKYAIQAFNAIHGTNFEVQDIMTWDKDLKDVDLIMHGSPCQDFSIAGLQAGGDIGSGTRSSLMYETIRIVGKIRPKYVIWENVKNILSAKHKHNFDNYLNALSSLGYRNYYKVLNAKDFGVPQNRERVFTVSIRNDIEQEFEFPQGFPLTKRLKDVLEENVEEKYYLSEKAIEGLQKHNEHHEQKGTGFLWKPKTEEDIASCLRANASLAPTDNTIKCVGKLDIKGHDCVKRVYDSQGISPTLTDMQGGNRQPKVIELNDEVKHQQDLVQHEDGICRTIPAGTHGSTPHLLKTAVIVGTASEDIPKIIYEEPLEREGWHRKALEVISPSGISTCIHTQSNNLLQKIKEEQSLRIRKLTPRECWRLMGFTDEEFDKAKNASLSNTQLYKQAGNSIVVDVLANMFINLLK